MKNTIYLSLLICFLVISYGCEKDDDNNGGSSTPIAEGTFSFKLNGEPLEFTITSITPPLAYECEKQSEDCQIVIEGENGRYNVAIGINRIQTGNFDCEDDGYSPISIVMLDTEDPDGSGVLFVGLSPDSCALNISILDNLRPTEQGSSGRLGRLIATFEFADNGHVLTDGYISASKD